MPFTMPNVDRHGRILQSEAKAPLGAGDRCLVCFETDPAKYQNCQRGDCYPVGSKHPESDPTQFKPPAPMVSAFELASHMRAKALSLGWDEDELRERLLRRARELEKGEHAEVAEEEF